MYQIVKWLKYFCSINVYVCFAGAAQSSLSTVERYDPRTNTWNNVAPMNIRRSLLNVAVLDGKSIFNKSALIKLLK